MAQEKIVRMIALIDYLNDRTKEYDEGRPIISDAQWDQLYFELVELEKTTGVCFHNSPTQSISYEAVNSLEKIVHTHDMLSLEKTKSIEVVKNFIGKKRCLAMCKMDGLTCSLTYENGELIKAETRGNGKVGENILHNARVLPSIPKRIPNKETIIIDGEIICNRLDFEKFSNTYANPRNFAAGSIRLLDAKECSKRDLQFIAWEVIQGLDKHKFLSDKLQALTNYGFYRVPYFVLDKTFDMTFEESLTALDNIAQTVGYPIDGIVFKFDDIKYGKNLGQTSHHFKNAIAYKFYDEEYYTELLNIEYTMGRTGVLTPVAVFTPIEIEDTIVERASLHNLSIMQEVLGEYPYIGQPIWVSKRNMIIPQIERSEKSVKSIEEKAIHIPNHCPICNKATTFIKAESGTIDLFCTNSACEGKLINRLDHFCGKKGLDIKGLSKATLEKLINLGWVNSFSDLFTLKEHRNDWIKQPGFGDKSVDKILEAIESSRNCELKAFIAALGIPLIGTTAAKELEQTFVSWNNFINAIDSKYHFYDIPNFGIEMHTALINFNYTEAMEIANNYINFQTTNTNQIVDNKLKDKVIVITGKLNNFKNRDELKTIIENYGGKVSSAISNKTNYLINNDLNSASSKNLAAKKLNIPILSEEDFIETFSIT